MEHRNSTSQNTGTFTVPKSSHTICDELKTLNSKVEAYPMPLEPEDSLNPGAFPTEKISWSELKRRIELEDLHLLRRSVKQQRFYSNYSNKLKLHWKSVYDFILCEKFNYEVAAIPLASSGSSKSISNLNTVMEYHRDQCEGDLSLLPTITTPPSGMQWAAKTPKRHSNSTHVHQKQKVLVPNDFPYYFEDRVEHWCLWKLGGDVTQEDVEIAIKDLGNRKCYVEFMHWINPIDLKSLPDIDHVHIVCLREASNSP